MQARALLTRHRCSKQPRSYDRGGEPLVNPDAYPAMPDTIRVGKRSASAFAATHEDFTSRHACRGITTSRRRPYAVAARKRRRRVPKGLLAQLSGSGDRYLGRRETAQLHLHRRLSLREARLWRAASTTVQYRIDQLVTSTTRDIVENIAGVTLKRRYRLTAQVVRGRKRDNR